MFRIHDGLGDPDHEVVARTGNRLLIFRVDRLRQLASGLIDDLVGETDRIGMGFIGLRHQQIS
ncbi:hypothetical protein [Methylobacterium nodulans]|uniref:hypothetical protein n=1 Tax=Methylobacterium nodulans TaxID=114616 RepID=UPI0005C22F53|nr:hypothetical protein [Methylobacterium nodulans]